MASIYPEITSPACTFADLFREYLHLWPEAVAETRSREHYAQYPFTLFRQAESIAADFPDVDLWEVLPGTLMHSLKWYDAKKGTFESLFRNNLREHLRKTAARQAAKAEKTARRERRAAIANLQARRDREHDEVAVAYERWSRHLLNVASERLEPDARLYVQMKRQGATVREIAKAVGLSEKTLWNKFGGPKLAGMVRKAVRQMVLELPVYERRLLDRHLVEEAGLSVDQAQRLLGVPISVDESVPVLEEDALLRKLDWGDGQKSKYLGSPLSELGVCLETAVVAAKDDCRKQALSAS